jgi:hypothetical protein
MGRTGGRIGAARERVWLLEHDMTIKWGPVAMPGGGLAGPPTVADFDGDGAPEVAIVPFHELLLLDARTGRIKDRCRFTDTRSYGFFGVYDFEGDGNITTFSWRGSPNAYL